MKRLLITAADGHKIALWRMEDNPGPVVLLTHGTFSNFRTCTGLAEYLSRQGFAPWIFDWRGHGASEKPAEPHSFDDVARYDVPAALDAVTAMTGQEKVFVVGHSGGGLAAAMWMARNPELAKRSLVGLVMLAAQATHAATSWRNRLAIRAIDMILAKRSTAPGHRLGIGPEPESALLMRQWCGWNLSRRFVGRDGFDYLPPLIEIELPVLAFAGGGDRFIAPSDGCRHLVHAFGGGDKTFYHCSLQEGYAEDYTHDRIIISRPASREIWPKVHAWMRKVHERGAVA